MYLEHFDLTACRVQVFCIFSILILFECVDLYPERYPFLSSMFSWRKFCTYAVYLAQKEVTGVFSAIKAQWFPSDLGVTDTGNKGTGSFKASEDKTYKALFYYIKRV